MSDKICNDHDCPFNHTCKKYSKKDNKNAKESSRMGLNCNHWEEK